MRIVHYLLSVISWVLRLVVATLSLMVAWNTGMVIGVVSRANSLFGASPAWAPDFAWSAAFVGALTGWRLFAWTTRPIQPGARRAPLLAWVSTGVIGAGLLWPFSTLESFVSCRDECHGFIFVAPLAGLICLVGAIGLSWVAREACVPPSPTWKYLRQGLPRSFAARLALMAIPIATAMLTLVVNDVPIFVGLVWSGAAVALVVSGLGAFRSRNQGGQDSGLTVDLRPVVLALAGALVVEGVLILSWLEQFFAPLI